MHFSRTFITLSPSGPNVLSIPFSASLSLCSLMPETKFHTHATPQAKISFYVFQFLRFETANEKAKISEFNVNKRFPSLICSNFRHESNFDLLSQ
jgi:hypothetical protein